MSLQVVSSAPVLRVRGLDFGFSGHCLFQNWNADFPTGLTLVEGGEDVFASPLPPRLVWVMGAEQSGMDRDFASRCDRRVSIPGTGAVESLNVASATAVLLAAWAQRRG